MRWNLIRANLLWLLLPLIAACRGPEPLIKQPGWHWQRAEAGLSQQVIVTSVAVDPANPSRIWAGYYGHGGLTHSEDGGQTWSIGIPGFADNPVFDVLIQPAASAEGPATIWVASRDGLLRSTDGGSRWQQPDLPRATTFSLATDGAGRLYAGLDDAGIYIRQANEETWQPLVDPTEALASAAVLALAVADDGQTIYAGTSGQGIFASRNGGRTWRQTYQGEYAPNLAINPQQPHLAVASLRDRLVRTEDGGQSWHTLPDSTGWGWQEIVSLVWLADGTLAAGTGQSQLYVSRDTGDSWLEQGSLAAWGLIDLAVVDRPVGPPAILAGTWGGIYHSDDGGQTWQNLAPELGVPDARTLLSTGENLFAGTRTGIFRWESDSAKWVNVSPDLPRGGVNVLRQDPVNSAVIYGGTSGNGLYRSDDGGASWRQISTSAVGITDLAIDPNNSGHLYMLAAWERAYESWDGGQTWQARWDGFGNTLETASLVIDPDPAGGPTFYVGAEWGLYRSQGSDIWEIVGRDIIDETMLSLMIQRPEADAGPGSTLYIGATRGVYRSRDRGQTVQGCANGWGCGLQGISVTALLADPVELGRLFAGTAYAGVYQSTDGGDKWQPIGPPDLGETVIEAMAWGPGGELFIAAPNGVWRGVEQ